MVYTKFKKNMNMIIKKLKRINWYTYMGFKLLAASRYALLYLVGYKAPLLFGNA